MKRVITALLIGTAMGLSLLSHAIGIPPDEGNNNPVGVKKGSPSELALQDLLRVLAREQQPERKQPLVRASEFHRLAGGRKEDTGRLLVKYFVTASTAPERNDLLLLMGLFPNRIYLAPLLNLYSEIREKRQVISAGANRLWLIGAIADSGRYEALPMLFKIIDSRAGIDIKKDELNLIQFAADQDFRTALSWISTSNLTTLSGLHKLKTLLTIPKGLHTLGTANAHGVILAVGRLFSNAYSSPDVESLYDASLQVRAELLVLDGDPHYSAEPLKSALKYAIDAIDEARGYFSKHREKPFPSE